MFPKPILIVGILGIVLVAAAVPFAMDPIVVNAQTDTQKDEIGPFSGRGGYPDLESDALKWGEAFDGTKALTTWLSDGKSQKIAVQGKVKAQAQLWEDAFCHIKFLRYRFQINTGGGFKSFVNDAFPDGDHVFRKDVDCTGIAGGTKWYDMPSVVFQIDGIVADGAVLRVWFEASRDRDGGGDWHWLAKDEMVLRRGIPLVEWGANQYAVGETAILRTEVPFVYFDGGNFTEYYLSVYNENTGDNCKDAKGTLLDRVPIQQVRKTWEVPVTADMFVVTAQCQNRLRAVVRNELLNADQDDTSIIDIEGYGPTVTDVDSDKGEYEEGDTVTITWDAEPNPTTKLPIVKYHITAQIGGLVLTDTDTTSKQASFIAPTAGFLEVEVTAYDEGCRPSEIMEVVLEVGNVLPRDFCLEHPNDPVCGGKKGIDWAKIILTIGIVILGFFLGFVAYHLVGMVDEKWGAIAMAIVVLASWIAAALVWL